MQRDDRDDHIDQALAAIGGEDTEFYLTARRDGGEGRRVPVVALSCRFQNCGWGETVGEMELWEFAADAREHWERRHARPAKETE